MTTNGREEWVSPHHVSAEAKVADYSKRRLELADEIAQLGEQQRQFVQNASVMGRRKGDVKYAERARRIAQLLAELVNLEETYSVRAD
jgi:phage host-nuclease inhibitor protein Gam